MGPKNNLYRTLFQESKDAVFIINFKGKIVDANAAFLKMIGYAASTIKRKVVTDLIPNEKEFETLVSLLQAHGFVQDYPMQLRCKDGTLLDTRSSITVEHDEHGRIDSYLGIVRNMTERNQANEELRKRQELAVALNQLSQDILTERDPVKILKTVAQHVVHLFDATSAYITEFHEETGIEKVVADFYAPEASAAERVSDLGVEYSLDDFEIRLEEFKAQGYFIFQEDDPTIPAFEAKQLKEYGATTILEIPLISHGRLIGLIDIWESRQRREYSEIELEMAQTIGRQVALAVDNARLYQQATRELSERQQTEKNLARSYKNIQTKAEDISFLNKMAEVLHQSLDFDKVINQAADLIMEYTQATSSAFFTIDETTDSLQLTISRGFNEETLQAGTRLPIKGSLSGSTLTQRKIITSEDVASDERTVEKLRQSLANEGLKSIISVPLLYQDSALGVVNLLFKERETPSAEERETLLLIGRTIALAMSNAQHVARIEEQIKERQQTQQTLQEQEQLLRLVLDTIPQAVFWKDLNSIFLGCNQAFAHDAGFESPESLIGKSDYDLAWKKGEADFFVVADRQVMESNTAELGIIEPQLQADGKQAWLETNKAPLHNADGKVIGIFGTYQDVTERYALQTQLEDSLTNRNKQLEISQALTQAQGVEEVLQTMVDQLNHYPQVAISATQLVIEGDAFVDVTVAQNAHESGLAMTPLGTRRNHQKNPLAAYYNAQTPFVSNQMISDEAIPENIRQAFKAVNIASMAILPLTAGGEWLGNLSLMCQEENFFDEQVLTVYRNVAEQGATAVRAARLYAEAQSALERREREVALSTQIAQEIASASDLSDLYQRVVNQIQEQFSYYHTQLLRYDPAMETVALTVGYGKVGEEMLALHHSMPIGVGLIGKAAATGQSILRGNLADDPDWRPNPLLPDAKSELAVPIKLGQDVLGVLDVQSDTVNALNENDQLILEGLCGQIAVAIESTILRQDMEARLRELNVLQRQMSREGWQEYKLVKERVSGYQYDHAGIRALAAEAGSPPTNGQPQNGKHKETTAVINAGVSSPLQIRGETIGYLGLQDDPERPLTAEDEEFLTAVSKEVAEALESARLFEQTQDALAEQERLTSELETVAQVSTAASTILEVDALLQAVVDLSKTSFNLYHVHIYLLNESGRKLQLKAGAGNVGRLMALEGREIHLDADSLIARAARTRQGVLENSVRKTIDFLPHPLLPHTQSEMAIPMILGDKLIGVLDLQSDKIDTFSQEDLKIQRTLASQISIAVENARQYAEQVETSAKLRALDQLKSEFLASMSHELRTPLNSIIGFADVLLEGLDGELNERMEEDVSLIRESGRHLRELIGDILDMSKIESGRMDLRYEDIDLRQMAQDVLAANQPLAQAKNLDMYLDVEDSILTVPADRTRIRQVLINIMGNAIKFTEKGSISLSIHDKDSHVLVAIRDTGIGIKEENIAIVFEQFRQIDGGLNRAVGGTGLGMPITKKLVEIHGGDIWIESVYGQGSTFFFTLPYIPPAKGDTGPLQL